MDHTELETGTRGSGEGARLLERIAARGNLHAAFKVLLSRDAGPGIDRVSARDYAEGIDARLDRLSSRLAAGDYRPSKVLRFYPEDEPDRPISVPTIEDRLVQRATAQIIGPLLEPTLSPAAWAYRRGRSVSGALAVVERHLREGLRFYVRTDIEKFFDRIPQERLMSELDQDIHDERVLRLVERMVRAQVLEGASSHELTLGVPQGSGLSPLLSNVYLRPFDAAVTGAGYPLVRYSDDMLVLCRSHGQAGEALDLLGRQAEALGLRLNARKTRRGHLGGGFTFLGARFGPAGRGPAAKAVAALTRRADELVAAGEEEAPGRLRALLGAWTEHHGSLAPHDITSLPVLLGASLAPEADQDERLSLLADRRTRLGAGAPAWLHVALAEVWADQGHAGPLLLDAAAAAGGLEEPQESRLLRAMAVVPEAGSDVISALRHAPRGLAAALGRAGSGELARVVRQGLFSRKDAARRAGDGGRHTPPNEAVAHALELLFTGREGIHALHRRDGRGHRRFFPVSHPLELKHWQSHLTGRARRGLYLVRADQSLRMACIVVGVMRRELSPGRDLQTAEGRVADTAALLARAAEELACASLLEATGSDLERRVWLPFASPVSLRDARALMLRLTATLGRLEAPLRLTLLPPNDRVLRPPGPVVGLPLGLHPRTRKRSRFVEPSGAELLDMETRLGRLQATPADRVHDLVRRGPLAADRGEARGEDVATLFGDLRRVLRLAQGCALLRGLVDKARDLGHLDGMELQTLYEFLGHLPGQGRESLVRILALTGQQDARSVERRLKRLPSMPISCVRIRQRHAALTLRVGCDCRFSGLHQGGYPTPLLHTLRPREIPGFEVGKGKRGRGKSKARRAGTSTEEPPAQKRRQSRDDGARPRRRAGKGAPASTKKGESEDMILALDQEVVRWRNIQNNIAGTRRSLLRCEETIARLLAELGTDRLVLRSAVVERWPCGQGGYRLHVDTHPPGQAQTNTKQGEQT